MVSVTHGLLENVGARVGYTHGGARDLAAGCCETRFPGFAFTTGLVLLAQGTGHRTYESGSHGPTLKPILKPTLKPTLKNALAMAIVGGCYNPYCSSR